MPELTRTIFTPLPLSTIYPRRWLLAQLQTQAQGLTGHLDEFWSDVADSGSMDWCRWRSYSRMND